MARRAREFRSDRRGGPNPFLAALAWIASAVTTAAAVVLVAAVLVIVEANRAGPAYHDDVQAVVIPRGAGAAQIARHLQQEKVIRSALVFRVATIVYARNRTLKAGEYAIEPGASMRSVIDQVAAGRVMLHPITAPEGLTSQMVADIINSSEVLSGEPVATPAEGALLPETYKVARGVDRASLIKKMMAAHDNAIDELWAKRARNLPIASKADAVILASIVEKETGVADERPRVAAVFVNRLRRGMKLESDPTIIYGVCRQFPDRCVDGKLVNAQGERRTIYQSEIDLDTGYNTYRIARLPPTPIANPGRAAIAAVLNPPQTNELFFVADGTGGHAFAATLAEHQRNVARWREIERSR